MEREFQQQFRGVLEKSRLWNKNLEKVFENNL